MAKKHFTRKVENTNPEVNSDYLYEVHVNNCYVGSFLKSDDAEKQLEIGVEDWRKNQNELKAD